MKMIAPSVDELTHQNKYKNDQKSHKAKHSRGLAEEIADGHTAGALQGFLLQEVALCGLDTQHTLEGGAEGRILFLFGHIQQPPSYLLTRTRGSTTP